MKQKSSNRGQTTRIIGAWLVAINLAACASAESGTPDPSQVPAEPGPELALDETTSAGPLEESEAFAVKQLPDGAEVRFYAHDDGSISVVEEGTATHVAVTSLPEFAEATARDLFWALAEADETVPDILETYHQRMLAESPELDQHTEKGWLLRQARLAPKSVTACANSVQEFVCETYPSSYPDGPGCFTSSGTLAWYDNAQPMRRYRTGICSPGTVQADVTWGYSGPGDCTVFRILHILRQGEYTNRNWQYWWSGPSGSTPRAYSNRVRHVSGSSFAWGVREKYHTSSSCTI